MANRSFMWVNAETDDLSITNDICTYTLRRKDLLCNRVLYDRWYSTVTPSAQAAANKLYEVLSTLSEFELLLINVTITTNQENNNGF